MPKIIDEKPFQMMKVKTVTIQEEKIGYIEFITRKKKKTTTVLNLGNFFDLAALI